MPRGTKEKLDERLAEILERIPVDPGVYLMKDKKGRIIYIGKAASLKSRVRQYFGSSGDTRAFVPLLGRLLGDIETVVTNNEKEALLLENNLIKQHQPRFNVKLVDDKNYLVLRLDPKARYPRLEVTRRIGADSAKYFGPYHSATSCRATLAMVNRHFKLRTCTDHVLNSRRRPCLQFQIKRCDAPCVFPIPQDEYGKQVQDVALFLEGKDEELIDRLKSRMKDAAGQTEYEIAGGLRDQIRALERTLEEQRVVSAELRDQDVFGFYREGDLVEIVAMNIRNGKLLGRQSFSLKGQEFPSEEVLSSVVSLYYERGAYLPDEVLLPMAIEDEVAKTEWLSDKREKKVKVLIPQRGTQYKLIELAQKNAGSSFVTRRDKKQDTETALLKLQSRLNLHKPPHRIECFDISHIQGTATVASRVVFIDGEPAKSEYRTFKIKTATNDDFASMYEVLSRRFRRVKDGDPAWQAPDLLVIDGGKGQLSTALAALRDAQIPVGLKGVDVIGLAKERVFEDSKGQEKKEPDRVFLARAKDPIRLRPNTAELFLLMRIRDEAHRFAVTFHKKLRRRRTLRSALEDVPGVGQKRKRELLRHFGSLRSIREATAEQLAQAPGMSLGAAESVVLYFKGQSQSGAIDVAEVDATSSAADPIEGGPPAVQDSEEVAEDALAEELEQIEGEESLPEAAFEVEDLDAEPEKGT